MSTKSPVTRYQTPPDGDPLTDDDNDNCCANDDGDDNDDDDIGDRDDKASCSPLIRAKE